MIPEPVRRAVDTMADFCHPWFLCGGWAVDAWLGRVTRGHADVDVFHDQQTALYQHVAAGVPIGHDDNVDDSTKEPWAGRWLDVPAHIHMTAQGIEWDFQLCEREGSDLVLRREPLRDQTATSIIIDHIRHSRVISINSTGDLDHLDVVTPEPNPEEQLEFRQEIAEIAKALATLPDKCRETLILRRVEGLSQQETAQRLGISVKTVEKHMARGVLILMGLFGRGGKFRTHSSKPAEQECLDGDGQTALSRDRPSGS